MVLRLDPGIPIVWRSPTAVQLGVEAAVAVVEDLQPGHERLLAALVAGISRSGYDMIARSVGVTAREAAALLRSLAPALRPPDAPAEEAGAAVLGSNPVAREIAALLRDEGRLNGEADEARLVILAADWVLSPSDHGAWLSRDVAHLPVVSGDRAITVGPLVLPGQGPCLYCVHLARIDADPAWPAIASQLWGRAAPAVSRVAIAEAAAFAIRRLAARRLDVRRASPERATSWRLGAGGTITPTVWRRHPDCLCSAPPESDWAPANAPASSGATR